jgi:DNA-binding LacI/PurR family transcriptional regulator
MPTTVKDIAKHLGITHSTVSKVLHYKPEYRISQQTIDAVRRAVEELDFVQNRAAVSLKTGYSRMITLWIGPIRKHSYTEMSSLLNGFAKAGGYDLLVKELPLHQDKRINMREMRKLPVDGMIVHLGTTEIDHGAFIRMFQDFPMVFITTYPMRDLSYVQIDAEGCTTRILEHVYEQGCRNIAFMIIRGVDVEKVSRAEEYVRFMDGHRLRRRIIEVPMETLEHAANSLTQYLKRHKCPDAICCNSDEMAMSTVNTLHRHGIHCPKDVLVSGCDNLMETMYTYPPLTTINVNLPQVMEAAMEMLKRQIQLRTCAPQSVSIRSQVVFRESTGESRSIACGPDRPETGSGSVESAAYTPISSAGNLPAELDMTQREGYTSH